MEADDGKCIDCGGWGSFTIEPSYIYGSSKSKCMTCNGTGKLQKATKCEHCGHVKQPVPEEKI
jgi:DnaJ-class molecular chaperone